jgi:hypothetical protein
MSPRPPDAPLWDDAAGHYPTPAAHAAFVLLGLHYGLLFRRTQSDLHGLALHSRPLLLIPVHSEVATYLGSIGVRMPTCSSIAAAASRHKSSR